MPLVSTAKESGYHTFAAAQVTSGELRHTIEGKRPVMQCPRVMLMIMMLKITVPLRYLAQVNDKVENITMATFLQSEPTQEKVDPLHTLPGR